MSDFFKKDQDCLDMPDVTQPDEQEDSDMEEEHADEVQVDEDEEDFGYVCEELDKSEPEGELAAEDKDHNGDNDFGPEDDGGALDPDQDMMIELGYGNL